ncbi:MAG: methyltransferase domain-containing protein [Candidatus Microsaccharimonas sp.]
MLWIYIVGMIVVFVGISVFFGAPYVPTRKPDLVRMFDELAPIGKADVVLDLGSGDGLVLREASRRGARAVGYEIHPLFVGISKLWSFSDKNVTVKWANAWNEPFPDDVTLVYAFAVGRDGKKLMQKMQREADRLGRPLSVVCYGNPLPGREPVRTYEAYALYIFS